MSNPSQRMETPALNVIDTSRFPVVHLHGPNLVPGDGPRIIADLETLIQYGKAFVLVILNNEHPHPRQHDEDKARMLWLKENKTRLAAVCHGIISVMPDSQRLPLIKKQAAGLQAALGIAFLVASRLADAEMEAVALLKEIKPI